MSICAKVLIVVCFSEDSAQNVLDLAVSVLTPSENALVKCAPVHSPLVAPLAVSLGVKDVIPEKKPFGASKFAEAMSDSPVKTVFVSDTAQAVPDKKAIVRRKSILDLIERYKNVVPATDREPAPQVNISQHDEWEESDAEIDFDAEENVQIRFALSPQF